MCEVMSHMEKNRESAKDEDRKRNEKFCPGGKCFMKGKAFLFFFLF